MATEDDSDVPETGAVFTFGKSKFGDDGANKFWIRNDEVVQVSCGDEHTALLAASGRVFTFGTNSWGQLGLGHTKTVNKPTRVKALKDEKVTHISCGRGHTLFATESGRLYACGANGEGQLGVDDTDVSISTPQHITGLPSSPLSMLSCGAEHSAALTDTGCLYVWGGGSEGQLGLGRTSQVNAPTHLHSDSPISWVSCGYYHTAFVTEAGRLFTFGESEGGKLGHSESPCRLPHPVSDLPGHFLSVSCGGSHTAAVTDDGAVYTFGDGSTGQLGHGTTVLTAETAMSIAWPRKVKVKAVSCGENHTALLTDDGQLYTFGDGRHGKLALGEESFSNQFHPLLVTRFVNFDVQQVSCGGCHTLIRGQLRTTHRDSDTPSDNSPPVTNSLASTFDLSSSISARNRRREKMADPRNLLNRTLPVLNDTLSASNLPPLSMTVPPIHPRRPLNTSSLESIKNKERRLALLEQDMINGDEINKHLLVNNIENDVTSKPRPLPRKPKTSKPIVAKRMPRLQGAVPDLDLAPDVKTRLSENEDTEESEEDKHSSKHHDVEDHNREQSKPANSEGESEHEEKKVKVKEKTKQTKKKNLNKRGIFQKRRIQHSSTEDEEEEASEESGGSEDDRENDKQVKHSSGTDARNSKKDASGSDDEKENVAKDGTDDDKRNSKVTKKDKEKGKKKGKEGNMVNGQEDKGKGKKSKQSDDDEDDDVSEDADVKKNSKNVKKTKKYEKSDKEVDSDGDDDKEKAPTEKKKKKEDTEDAVTDGDNEKDTEEEEKKNKDKDDDKEEEKVEKKSRTCVLL